MAGDPKELMAQSAGSGTPSAGAGGASVYCTRCGFPNTVGRGACLMCLAFLLDTSGGQSCRSCGTANTKAARFCRNCGGALELGAIAVPATAVLAERVLEAVGDLGIGAGGGAGDVGEYGDDMDYAEEAMGDYVGAEEDEYAPPPPPMEGAKPVLDEVAVDAIPGGIIETPVGPAALELDDEDDFAPPPPPGVVAPIALDDDMDFAPPPPPGVIEPDEDEFAPPPPPPGVIEPDEDEFAPPPPPPTGLIGDADEEFAPPPPPPGVVTPEAPTEASAEGDEGKKGEKKDDEFGDWALDFNQDA